jgi:hypothetical protein
MSHIAGADFNLQPMPAAAFQQPDASRDDGAQGPLKPLEITGFFRVQLRRRP